MARTVQIRLLPDKRVRIHWFQWDQAGPIEQPTNAVLTAVGPVVMGGAANGSTRRGRIACMPQVKSALPQMGRGIITPVVHSDDPRAATCPECLATQGWQDAMKLLEQTLDVAQQQVS
jgi:hypothetical protein